MEPKTQSQLCSIIRTMNISNLNNQKIVLIIPPTNPDGQLEDYDPREPLGFL